MTTSSTANAPPNVSQTSSPRSISGATPYSITNNNSTTQATQTNNQKQTGSTPFYGNPYAYQQAPQQQHSQTPSSPPQYPYQPNQYPHIGGSDQHYPSTGQNQQPGQPPIAYAGVSRTVYENTTVVLDGRRSYDPNNGGSIVGYQWVQLPTIDGVPVTLAGTNTATPYLIAPIVPFDNTILAFSLRVLDNHAAVSTNPAVVYVMVKQITHDVPAITSGNVKQPQERQQLPPPNTFYFPQQPLR